jgi:hypothetical protein
MTPFWYFKCWPKKRTHAISVQLEDFKVIEKLFILFCFCFFRFRVLGCFFFSFSTAERIRKPARLTSTRSGHSNDVTREYNITTLPKSSSSSSSSLSDPSLSVVVLLSFYNFRAYKYIMYKDVACDILFS